MPDVVGRFRAPRLSTPPASPSVGEMYYDTGTNKLYWWNGTVWFDATGGGGASGWASVLSAAPVLDVGMAGQIRAGRQLAVADFTALGLSAPAGLWNLSDLTDASGNGRVLTNKGAVAFGSGINGSASTAAVFSGSTGQALYISDTGVADPFRISAGSWGCWFRTAKRGVDQCLVYKTNSALTQLSYGLIVQAANTAGVRISGDGTTGSAFVILGGSTDIADDRWHFAVITADGAMACLYVDGVLEGRAAAPTPFPSAGPLNVGSYGADSTTAAGGPHFGQVDEAFVTADVLSDDQVRNLYCAKIPHTLAKAPVAASLDVRRLRKGAALAAADFPTPPLRLYNFTNGSLANEGSASAPVSNIYGVTAVTGADGTRLGAYYQIGPSQTLITSAYADLPQGTTPRSYGCWFQTTQMGSAPGVNSYDNSATTQVTLMTWGDVIVGDASIVVGHGSAGCISSRNTADYTTLGPFVADGQWHFAVAVETTAAIDGVPRKLYLDGKLVGTSTVMNPIAGLSNYVFRLACANNGHGDTMEGLKGPIDGVFVCGYALTGPQIAALYAKGSVALAASSRDPGSHVEAMDASNLYATFDTLDSQHQVDLAVGA